METTKNVHVISRFIAFVIAFIERLTFVKYIADIEFTISREENCFQFLREHLGEKCSLKGACAYLNALTRRGSVTLIDPVNMVDDGSYRSTQCINSIAFEFV